MLCIVHLLDPKSGYSKMLGKVKGEDYASIAKALGTAVKTNEYAHWIVLANGIVLERIKE